jgi:hypothetical protein
MALPLDSGSDPILAAEVVQRWPLQRRNDRYFWPIGVTRGGAYRPGWRRPDGLSQDPV